MKIPVATYSVLVPTAVPCAPNTEILNVYLIVPLKQVLEASPSWQALTERCGTTTTRELGRIDDVAAGGMTYDTSCVIGEKGTVLYDA